MKYLSTILPVAVLVMAGAADSTLAQSQTNQTLYLNIDLTAVSQGTATNTQEGVVTDLQFNRITSRNVIQAIGTALNDTFSERARLVVLAPTNSLDTWTIQIHDGTNAAVDVTGFFGHQPGSPVAGTWTNSRSGQSGTLSYSIDSFSLQDQAGSPALTEHFNVSGLTTLSSSTIDNWRRTQIGQVDNISAQVSGTGDYQGAQTLVSGSITAQGTDIESGGTTNAPASSVRTR